MGKVGSEHYNRWIEVENGTLNVHKRLNVTLVHDPARWSANVDARLLVAEVARVTGINFREVSPAARALTEEDCAILELHRLAEARGNNFYDMRHNPDGELGYAYWIYSYPDKRRYQHDLTAVELLAKVKAAMTPKRTVAEIKEDLYKAYEDYWECDALSPSMQPIADRVRKLRDELEEAGA
jgi:hypothetical protein